jgi:hypothetical protein
MNPSAVSGRRHYTKAERDGFVRRYRQGGVTQKEFARTHRLKLGTLLRWLYRRPPPQGQPGPLFQEIVLPAPAPTAAAGIEIGVGRDITVRLGSAATPEFIAQLVRNLQRVC